MDRYRFVLPNAEEMYEEMKYYNDLLNTMELKTPDQKYLESISPRYREMWLKMMRDERLSPHECVILQSMNFEPPPTLETGDILNAQAWLEYMTQVQQEVEPRPG